MPITPMLSKTVADIVAGNGDVTLVEAIAALGVAGGIVAFSKKIHLWEKLGPTERKEAELLDADMPSGWWRRLTECGPAAILSGGKFKWHHGSWSIGKDGNNLEVTTPMLDEDTNTLV